MNSLFLFLYVINTKMYHIAFAFGSVTEVHHLSFLSVRKFKSNIKDWP